VYGELGGVIVTSTLRSQSQPGSCLALVADWSSEIERDILESILEEEAVWRCGETLLKVGGRRECSETE
jgi:hypothetical protein